MSSERPAIVFEGVHKRFGPRQVLGGVDLAIAQGEIFAIIGPCLGRSFLEPPQRIATSGRNAASHAPLSPIGITGIEVSSFFTRSGERLTTPTASISGLLRSEASTPRPTLPYPAITTRIFSIMHHTFL